MPMKSVETEIRDFGGGFVDSNALNPKMYPRNAFSKFNNLFINGVVPRRRNGYYTLKDNLKTDYRVAFADRITNLFYLWDKRPSNNGELYYTAGDKLYFDSPPLFPDVDITPAKTTPPLYLAVPLLYQIPFILTNAFVFMILNNTFVRHNKSTTKAQIWDMYPDVRPDTITTPVAGVLNGTYRYLFTVIYRTGTESSHYYPFTPGDYISATPVNQTVRLAYSAGLSIDIRGYIDYIRIYRTHDISGSADPDSEPYYFLDQVASPVSGGGFILYNDNIPDTQLVDEYDAIEYLTLEFPKWLNLSNNRLVMTTLTNTVYFSDTYAYDSFRPENTVSIPKADSRYNPAHAHAYLNGVHYIFCKNFGVYGIRETGNASLPFVLQEVSTEYGADAPHLVRTVGGLIIFMYNGKLYAFNGQKFSFIGKVLSETFFTDDLDTWAVVQDNDSVEALRTAVDEETQELHIIDSCYNPRRHLIYDAKIGQFRTESFKFNAYASAGTPPLNEYTDVPIAIDFTSNKIISTRLNTIARVNRDLDTASAYKDVVGSAGAVGGITDYFVEAEIEKTINPGKRSHLKSIILYGRQTPGGATANAGYKIEVNNTLIGENLGISREGNEYGVNFPALYHKINIKQENVGGIIENDFNIEVIGLKYVGITQEYLKEVAG